MPQIKWEPRPRLKPKATLSLCLGFAGRLFVSSACPIAFQYFSIVARRIFEIISTIAYLIGHAEDQSWPAQAL